MVSKKFEEIDAREKELTEREKKSGYNFRAFRQKIKRLHKA